VYPHYDDLPVLGYFRKSVAVFALVFNTCCSVEQGKKGEPGFPGINGLIGPQVSGIFLIFI